MKKVKDKVKLVFLGVYAAVITLLFIFSIFGMINCAQNVRTCGNQLSNECEQYNSQAYKSCLNALDRIGEVECCYCNDVHTEQRKLE